MAAALRRGLLINNRGGRFGTSSSFSPPLVITDEQLAAGLEIMDEALAEVGAGISHAAGNPRRGLRRDPRGGDGIGRGISVGRGDPAIVPPFNGGWLDRDRGFATIVERFMGWGVHGLVIARHHGEGWALSTVRAHT